MPLTPSESFILVMLAIFTLPFLVWKLTGQRGFAPLVVIQIFAGVLLGPGIAGALAPDLHAAILSPPVITSLNGVALWAVVLFVFVAGLELDLRSAWTNRTETATVASLALLVPMATGAAAATLLLQLSPGWIGPSGTPLQTVLAIGMASAVTALPILIVFMDSLGILRHPLGQRVLRYASLDDLAIWAVLALILLDWDRLLRQVSFLVVFALVALALRRLLPRLSLTDRWYAALAWLLASALASDWAGLHYIVGAFLAGAVLDARWFDHARLDQFRDTVLVALMPVFFLATGLRTDWTAGGAMVIGGAALLLAAAIGGKLAGVHIAGRILGWPPGEATVIGWLLQTKALIMIIFANVLLDRGIITADTFTALLLMALGSTMLTLPVVLPRLARLVSPADRSPPAP